MNVLFVKLISVARPLLMAIFSVLAFGSFASATDPVHADFTIGDDGRIHIQAEVSGQSLTTLIDTGLSSTFLLTPDTAARVRPRYVPFLRTAPMRSVDGKGIRGRIAAIKLTSLGGVSGDWDIVTIIVDVPILRADAMMGMSFLKYYDATFDFQSRKLTLSEPASGADVAGAFTNCNANKPTFSLGGDCGSSAIYVDTGGQSTVMNSAMATRLGMPSDIKPETTTIRGASGRAITALRYDFPVEVGGLKIESFLVTDFPNRGGCRAPCAELILGMDALHRLSSLRITPTQIALIP